MDQTKANTKGNIPFSWEKKPGVSKLINQDSDPNEEKESVIKLPSPPCSIESPRVPTQETTKIPLPPCPCTFQPPSRNSSRKGIRKHDDPFLAAYKECTKSTKKVNKSSKKDAAGSGLWKGYIFNFSCKTSCNVRDGNLVRVSQIPYEIDKVRGEKLHHLSA